MRPKSSTATLFAKPPASFGPLIQMGIGALSAIKRKRSSLSRSSSCKLPLVARFLVLPAELFLLALIAAHTHPYYPPKNLDGWDCGTLTPGLRAADRFSWRVAPAANRQ